MKYCNFVLHLYELYDIICKLKEVVIMDRQLVLLNNPSQMINKETINKLIVEINKLNINKTMKQILLIRIF